MNNKVENIYRNLDTQIGKIHRHSRQGSFKTRERYLEGTRRFCRFLAEQYKMQKFANISDKHIKAYIDFMQEKGLSASTVKTDLAAIRYFHDHVDNPRYQISSNDQFELEKRNFGGVDRTWSEEEYERMISLARQQGYERVASAMELARIQGLRIHEVFRLDRGSAERALRTGSLVVKGKGGKERVIPLTEKGRDALDKAIGDVKRGEKLFVNEGERTHLVIKEVQNWIDRNRALCAEPNRSSNMTFHGLRHSYAENQYEKNIKEGKSELEARKIVSNLLGHERDDVTRIYLPGRE